MALWSEKSADYAVSRKSFQESFAANRIDIKSTTVGRLTLDGDHASLRLVVDSSAVKVRTGKPASGFGRLNRTLHFVKESGSWKVLRYVSSEEELAAALATAKSGEERKALLEASKELLTNELVRALNEQGMRLRTRGNYLQAMAIFQLSLKLAQASDNQAAVADALRNIAIIYTSQGSYTQGLDYFFKSLKLSEECHDQAAIAVILNAIGGTYQLPGSYRQALEYYQKCLKLREAMGGYADIAAVLLNVSAVHFAVGNYTQALDE
jgi:tetratricopeptide (TPR) repeat protein